MSLVEIPFLPTIVEHDVDLLVLEALHDDHRFVRWMGERLSPTIPRHVFIDAWVSVTNARGESDLIFLVQNGDENGTHAFLVENKINSPFTKRQPVRYRERGELGCAEGRWTTFQ